MDDSRYNDTRSSVASGLNDCYQTMSWHSQLLVVAIRHFVPLASDPRGNEKLFGEARSINIVKYGIGFSM